MAGGNNASVLGTKREEGPSHSGERQTAPVAEHRRVARCECGAILVGDSQEELYEAAQLHLARHHPQLLGALGLELVSQMAENVGGVGA